jgi:hypothetical protein
VVIDTTDKQKPFVRATTENERIDTTDKQKAFVRATMS